MLLKRRIILLLLFLVWGARPELAAQPDTLRIATYNLLKFPTNLGQQRLPYLQKVIRAIEPDLLVVVELETAEGLSLLKQQIFDALWPGEFTTAPFVDGPDTDAGLIYRADKFTLKAARPLPTNLRNIMEFIFEVEDLRLFLYAAHFKAGSDYESMRLQEATVLRNRLNILPASSYVLVAGDLNIYRASEAAFVELTESQTTNQAELYDPVNQLGDWHNNRQFAVWHTQSTRTEALADEGSTGGLDDRFDFLLVNRNVLSKDGIEILPATYKAFGNDGRHLNAAVNSNFNTAVPDSIADALYFASDHLPVVADFVFHPPVSVVEVPETPAEFHLEAAYPNPVPRRYPVHFRLNIPAPGEVKLTVIDLLGRIVWQNKRYVDSAGIWEQLWSGSTADGTSIPAGIYFLQAFYGKQRAVGRFIIVH